MALQQRARAGGLEMALNESIKNCKTLAQVAEQKEADRMAMSKAFSRKQPPRSRISPNSSPRLRSRSRHEPPSEPRPARSAAAVAEVSSSPVRSGFFLSLPLSSPLLAAHRPAASVPSVHRHELPVEPPRQLPVVPLSLSLCVADGLLPSRPAARSEPGAPACRPHAPSPCSFTQPRPTSPANHAPARRSRVAALAALAARPAAKRA
eukprot:XP_020406532.1 uncharacterized protein LOC109945129 [Zea mays]